MSAPSATDQPARHTNGRFSPGNPGRRAGARGRVSHRATLAILEDFEPHRDGVLELLRRSCTPAYFAVLTRMLMLDRELKVETPASDDHSDAELAPTVRLARMALTANPAPRAALTVFNGETGPEPRQRRSGALRAPHLR